MKNLQFIYFIFELGIISNEFSEILKQVFYIDSNASTNNSKNLINIIYENKNKILSLLKSYLGSGYDMVILWFNT
ncbi:hypothetical protein D8X55_02160 [Malacoplasma penetrans]|uniref:Uncharacterized protein n=1 Tax=Malacoplasma penetrans (strain HF-2) TaxID=272633 RepID=Q8EVE7_MALP2|nr:hypothetical protein [Malacoplasma penetrans]RXY96949.1 hypothetical protein D8X55_02160 [Malacoplasma penetrans]BAC44407.1 hypothetical protein [Malacoplasma penetrans HF-2]